MTSRTQRGSVNGVATWINSLSVEHKVSPKGLAVTQVLASNPRLSSYGSVREVAEKANVSIGTVTRTAQMLGFVGWSALQEELRALYLTSLSATQVAEQHAQGQELPAYASLSRDRDNLNAFTKTVNLNQIVRSAAAIARSRRTYVVAIGSFNGIGQILAHSAWLHGYDVRLLAEEAQIVNTISLLEPDDLVVVVSFWRLYEKAYQAIQACNDKQAPVVLLTENVTKELEGQCLECIRIPSEGTGFSPSLTTATAVVHAIVAELIAIDPERSTKSIERAEKGWERFSLMHRFSTS